MSTNPPRRLERHCLVTIGATARFTQLLTEVLEPAFLDFLARDRYTHLTLQCGADYDHFSRTVLPGIAPRPRPAALEIAAFDFVDDLTVEMTKCRAHPGLREAGVMICHAGTGTILDGMRTSVPLVVVPNPTLKDNHQTELAEEINRQGYGIWGRLGDVSHALEQLALLLDKNERQLRPHSVSGGGGVDLWQISSAMLGRYAVHDAAPAAAPSSSTTVAKPPPATATVAPTAPTAATDCVIAGPGEVMREEEVRMAMG